MLQLFFKSNPFTYLFLAVSLLFVASCDDDNDDIIFTDNAKSYTLSAVGGGGVSGDATFTELSNGLVQVDLDLNGTQAGDSHPAHIHVNTAAEGGAIAISLAPVDGATGLSTTLVSALDDGTPTSYAELLEFDGYINVHLSASDLATVVSQGDIGQNELTGVSKTYVLEERDVDGINGSVIFSERVNGEALAQITLEETPDDGIHPAHIHMNSAAEGGSIAYTFTPVDGSSGTSASNISVLDDGSPFGYAEILDFDGYVNVHLSMDELTTIVAQGDIGQNELTGTSVTYQLNERDVAGISGTVVFSERLNGEALAMISLVGTSEGGSHPAHIHANSATEGGPIIFSFNPVDGSNGISRTNLSMFDDGSEFNYSDIESVDGYVNVHLSLDDLSTIVAQGNIGSND